MHIRKREKLWKENYKRMSQDESGRVGNQRNYRILKFKKRSPEEEENIGYRVASNKKRLKNMQIKFPIRTDKMLLLY